MSDMQPPQPFTKHSEDGFLSLALEVANNYGLLVALKKWTETQDQRNEQMDERLGEMVALAKKVNVLEDGQRLQAQQNSLTQQQMAQMQKQIDETTRTRRTWLDTLASVLLSVAVVVLLVLLLTGQLAAR